MLRELVWVALAGWVWGFGQCVGWKHALYVRDHANEISRWTQTRIPPAFRRAFEQ